MTAGLRARGFAYIAAIVFLVVLSGLALALVRLQGAQQATIDGSVLGMRAGQAARAGVEWAYYQLGSGATADCTRIDNTSLGDFVTDTGFRVTVRCGARTYQEGQTPDGASLAKTIFTLTSTACNGRAACPDAGAAARAGYVERQRSATFCVAAGNQDCY